MSDLVTVTGMVLKVAPLAENDKRLVILTKERGKIAAFAKGVRRQNSPLQAACRPFCFGEFTMYEGRTSYTVRSAEISNYFEALGNDMELVCYASYFAELADYYTRENNDERQMLLLLFQSFRALEKETLPNGLVRLIYEMKAMAVNGEYAPQLPFELCQATLYTLEYIVASPVEKLYTFRVSDQVMKELGRAVGWLRQRFIDRQFHSLKVLESMTAFPGPADSPQL